MADINPTVASPAPTNGAPDASTPLGYDPATASNDEIEAAMAVDVEAAFPGFGQPSPSGQPAAAEPPTAEPPTEQPMDPMASLMKSQQEFQTRMAAEQREFMTALADRMGPAATVTPEPPAAPVDLLAPTGLEALGLDPAMKPLYDRVNQIPALQSAIAEATSQGDSDRAQQLQTRLGSAQESKAILSTMLTQQRAIQGMLKASEEREARDKQHDAVGQTTQHYLSQVGRMFTAGEMIADEQKLWGGLVGAVPGASAEAKEYMAEVLRGANLGDEEIGLKVRDTLNNLRYIVSSYQGADEAGKKEQLGWHEHSPALAKLLGKVATPQAAAPAAGANAVADEIASLAQGAQPAAQTPPPPPPPGPQGSQMHMTPQQELAAREKFMSEASNTQIEAHHDRMAEKRFGPL